MHYQPKLNLLTGENDRRGGVDQMDAIRDRGLPPRMSVRADCRGFGFHCADRPVGSRVKSRQQRRATWIDAGLPPMPGLGQYFGPRVPGP